MPKEHVDTRNLQVRDIPQQHDSLQAISDNVTLVVTQAFGPGGDNLVGFSDVKFNGYPAVTLLLRTPDGREGLVHLSPIHGDKRKTGFIDITPGTRCELLCPVTRRPLDRLGPVDDGSGATYYALYLTPKLSRGHAVAVTDIWDHFHSRIVDDEAVISYWAQTHAL
ncbi:hypothetical protein ATI61_10687 [Archangium gephyra]|uniref:Uncharacterized protein n=1 Tax=Archangium gephyra TaxID=48 RepID=A0AAC8TAE6_9BACT|nr:hypothetical protein [Archangium gephyra]AKI98691.1 Hypothetical protein AA314_00318 [Archangium gephyra]REG30618.1 hypothetical protein ATI61_10687 [Archangium gephyra]